MGMKYEKGEFLTIPNKSALRGLNPNLQVLFFWLCDHADDNMKSFPSRQTLAAECGMGVKTLDRSMQQLVELGYVVKTVRTSKDEHLTNLYEIIIMGGSVKLTPGSVKKGKGVASKMTPPSVKKDIENSTHLTQSNELLEKVDNLGTKEAASGRPDLQPELDAFIEMRQAIGKPLTAHALRLINDKLKLWYPGDTQKQRQCLEQSIMNGWSSIVELKDKPGETAPAVASMEARYILHPEKYRRGEG